MLVPAYVGCEKNALSTETSNSYLLMYIRAIYVTL